MELNNMNHILNILTLAEKSRRIGILLSRQSGDAEILAAHALKEKLGEKTTIMNASDELQDRWSHLFPKERPAKETAISLNVDSNPIDELRYEKENGNLRIFLTSQEHLTKDSFSLEEFYPVSDMIIALGFSSEKDVRDFIDREAPLRNPEALLTLSLGTSLKTSFHSEEGLPPSVNSWNINAMQLWGRALLRSQIEEELDIFWAFLPKEDFTKTNQNPDILPRLITEMSPFINIPRIAVLLWQDSVKSNYNVHALIYTKDGSLLAKISQTTGTTTSESGSHLIIESFASFSEAEIEIRKIIKQSL